MKIKIIDGMAYEIVKELPGGVMLQGIMGLHTGTFLENHESITDLLE